MEKEALEYAVGLAEPHIERIGGEMYSDKPLKRIVHNPKAGCMESIQEYLEEQLEGVEGFTIIS